MNKVNKNIWSDTIGGSGRDAWKSDTAHTGPSVQGTLLLGDVLPDTIR